MRVRLVSATLVLGLTLVACSSTDPAGAIAVTATDKECRVAQTELPAGTRSFTVTNKGEKVTEVYVYSGDKVVAERENIGPGTSASFTAKLAAGAYEIACKPGQAGNGIRQPITVTGSGGAAKPGETIDRESRGTVAGFSVS